MIPDPLHQKGGTVTELHYDVYVSDGVERQRPDRLPDGGPIVSSTAGLDSHHR